MSHIRLARPGNDSSETAAAATQVGRTTGRRWLVAAACLLGQTGCTSALTTAYLRDALWDGLEHAAEAAPGDPPAAESAPDSAAASAAVERDIAVDRADAERRQAAIEEAIARLSRIGTLDAAAQATLVETLQATQQEDWPVVIDAFSATLAESKSPSPPPAAAAEPDAEDTSAAETRPVAEVAAVTPEPAPAATVAAPAAAIEPAAVVESPAAPQPATETPAEAVSPLALHNACFASRVRAWGLVERFPDDRFAAGQEVIVYFELDGLAAGESPSGFTTSIDTALRLVAEDGRELHAWKFEPVTETCVARRRDYFARYVVRLPDATAGRCRLEIAVTDTLAGTTASGSVPCVVE